MRQASTSAQNKKRVPRLRTEAMCSRKRFQSVREQEKILLLKHGVKIAPVTEVKLLLQNLLLIKRVYMWPQTAKMLFPVEKKVPLEVSTEPCMKRLPPTEILFTSRRVSIQ